MKSVQEITFKTSEIAYAVTREGKIIAWNRAAENVFGYPDTKAIGKKCWELLRGEDAFGNAYCCEGCPIRTAAFNNRSVNCFHIKFKTASHEIKDFAVSALLLKGATGNDVMVALCRCNNSEIYKPVSDSGQSRAPSPRQRGNLTQREQEVLFLLSEGHATTEISSSLGISTHTVRNHVQHILSKLQVQSRLKAINLSRRLGMI